MPSWDSKKALSVWIVRTNDWFFYVSCVRSKISFETQNKFLGFCEARLWKTATPTFVDLGSTHPLLLSKLCRVKKVDSCGCEPCGWESGGCPRISCSPFAYSCHTWGEASCVVCCLLLNISRALLLSWARNMWYPCIRGGGRLVLLVCVYNTPSYFVLTSPHVKMLECSGRFRSQIKSFTRQKWPITLNKWLQLKLLSHLWEQQTKINITK